MGSQEGAGPLEPQEPQAQVQQGADVHHRKDSKPVRSEAELASLLMGKRDLKRVHCRPEEHRGAH